MIATANDHVRVPSQPHTLLSTEECAEYLRVHVQTLANWRHLGRGPKHLTVGRVVRYRLRDVDAWLANQSK